MPTHSTLHMQLPPTLAHTLIVLLLASWIRSLRGLFHALEDPFSTDTRLLIRVLVAVFISIVFAAFLRFAYWGKSFVDQAGAACSSARSVSTHTVALTRVQTSVRGPAAAQKRASVSATTPVPTTALVPATASVPATAPVPATTPRRAQKETTPSDRPKQPGQTLIANSPPSYERVYGRSFKQPASPLKTTVSARPRLFSLASGFFKALRLGSVGERRRCKEKDALSRAVDAV